MDDFDNEANIGIDAIFIVAQHDKCAWAESIVGAASLCRALYFEEAAWSGFCRTSRGPKSRTSLMYHAKMNNVDRLSFLIKRGPPNSLLDVQDTRGRTALHWAASQNACDAIKLLFKSGASIDPKMDNDCTPLHVAVNNGHLEATKIILELSKNAVICRSRSLKSFIISTSWFCNSFISC
jgi:ankyrin repeat protein